MEVFFPLKHNIMIFVEILDGSLDLTVGAQREINNRITYFVCFAKSWKKSSHFRNLELKRSVLFGFKL